MTKRLYNGLRNKILVFEARLSRYKRVGRVLSAVVLSCLFAFSLFLFPQIKACRATSESISFTTSHPTSRSLPDFDYTKISGMPSYPLSGYTNFGQLERMGMNIRYTNQYIVLAGLARNVFTAPVSVGAYSDIEFVYTIRNFGNIYPLCYNYYGTGYYDTSFTASIFYVPFYSYVKGVTEDYVYSYDNIFRLDISSSSFGNETYRPRNLTNSYSVTNESVYDVYSDYPTSSSVRITIPSFVSMFGVTSNVNVTSYGVVPVLSVSYIGEGGGFYDFSRPENYAFANLSLNNSSYGTSFTFNHITYISEYQQVVIPGNTLTDQTVEQWGSVNSDMTGQMSDYESAEDQLTDNFSSDQASVNESFIGWTWGALTQGATYIATSIQNLYDNAGDFRQLWLFPLLLGVALVFLGRWGSVAASKRRHDNRHRGD